MATLRLPIAWTVVGILQPLHARTSIMGRTWWYQKNSLQMSRSGRRSRTWFGSVSQKCLSVCPESHIFWNSGFLKLANTDSKESVSMNRYHKYADEIICNKSFYWLTPSHMTWLSRREWVSGKSEFKVPHRDFSFLKLLLWHTIFQKFPLKECFRVKSA